MMNSTLNALLAGEHTHDLQRAARGQRAYAAPVRVLADTIELRYAAPGDAAEVRRLADLDEAPEPAYPVLLAVVDGRPVAALSVADGRVVANPFLRTIDAVALLRMRAAHLSGDPVTARARRRWRLRLA